MSDMEHHAKPQTSDDQIEGQSTQPRVFEEFYGDFESIESLGVTNQELQALSRASLLGLPNSKEDVIFILGQIRESMKSLEAQASDPLKATDTPAKKIEESARDFGKITEAIRRDALAKLDDRDLKAAIRRRTAIGRLESAWGLVTMLTRRAHSLVVQVSYKLIRRSVISLPV
jgi:hypothetical protein